MLVILSPASVESDDVMDEVSFALEGAKTIIPILFKDCPIPFRLRRVQYIDFRRDYERGLREIVRALGAGPTGPAVTIAAHEREASPQIAVESEPEKASEIKQTAPVSEQAVSIAPGVVVRFIRKPWVWITVVSALVVASVATWLFHKASTPAQPQAKSVFAPPLGIAPQSEISLSPRNAQSGEPKAGSTAPKLGSSERKAENTALPKVGPPAEGWIVGSAGTILHSGNGGLTWQKQASGTGANLLSVTFPSATAGWAVGGIPGVPLGKGFAVSTTDGGAHWASQDIGASWLFNIDFVARTLGRATGFTNRGVPSLFFTEDGGASWTTRTIQPPHEVYGLSFVDSNWGWLCGVSGTVLHTENGGMTWKQQDSKTANNLYDIRFLNRTSGWAVGAYETVVHTDNSGSNWVVQHTGKGNAPVLSSVDFVTQSSGWAVGERGTILHTEDAGRGWQPQTSGTMDDLKFVRFVARSSGWIVGKSGTILHTEDGGNHWQKQDAGTTENLNAITFAPAGKPPPPGRPPVSHGCQCRRKQPQVPRSPLLAQDDNRKKQSSDLDLDRPRLPDIGAVVADAAVGRELADARDVEHRHARPVVAVAIGRADAVLAVDV
jgi:photosystem II stability/assembly factor-like uncharacterized protein